MRWGTGGTLELLGKGSGGTVDSRPWRGPDASARSKREDATALVAALCRRGVVLRRLLPQQRRSHRPPPISVRSGTRRRPCDGCASPLQEEGRGGVPIGRRFRRERVVEWRQRQLAEAGVLRRWGRQRAANESFARVCGGGGRRSGRPSRCGETPGESRLRLNFFITRRNRSCRLHLIRYSPRLIPAHRTDPPTVRSPTPQTTTALTLTRPLGRT